jgi:enamine deaminase RidA (YjgF/YER057c/UK114 family)
MYRHLRLLSAGLGLVVGLATVNSVSAADITRVAIPNSNFPISLAVRVPAGAETVYFSGITPPVAKPDAPKESAEAYGGDTEAQANAAFDRLGGALQSQGLSFADIVSLRVYLVGDSAKGGKLDFAGLQSAYTKYFATPAQPNKPARTTVQVAALAAPGILVEIEATAAK